MLSGIVEYTARLVSLRFDQRRPSRVGSLQQCPRAFRALSGEEIDMCRDEWILVEGEAVRGGKGGEESEDGES